jgi:hypothetical protein
VKVKGLISGTRSYNCEVDGLGVVVKLASRVLCYIAHPTGGTAAIK